MAYLSLLLISFCVSALLVTQGQGLGSTQFRFDNIQNHPNFHLLPNPLNGDECGHSMFPNSGRARNRRLVGGKPSMSGEFPWMVQLVQLNEIENRNYFKCGASLINSRYVLTAAHCVHRIKNGFYPSYVNLAAEKYYSSTEIYRNCSSSQYYWRQTTPCSAEVEEIIIHKFYNYRTGANDIALIRLKNELILDGLTYISPVCLPFSRNLIPENGNQLEIAGKGRFDPYNESSTKFPVSLNKLKLRMTDRSDCDVFYSIQLENDRICAIGENEQGPCSEDDGNPVTFVSKFSENPRDQRNFQIGLVSSYFHGKNCGAKSQPTLLTNLAHFIPWILDNIRV